MLVSLGAGVVHGVVVRDEKGHNLVFMHGVHQEHLLEAQHFPALEDLEHGTDGIALMLLALLDEDLIGALIIVGAEGVANPGLVAARVLTSFFRHYIC